MQKGQKIEANMQGVGVRCVGHLDGDTQQPHYFFLLWFFFLFFKTLLLFYSLKSYSLDSHCLMFSLISLIVSVLRLALSHVSSNL
jgi:hypothetical membrane protein